MKLSLQKQLGITDLQAQVDDLKKLTSTLRKELDELKSRETQVQATVQPAKEEPVVRYATASQFRRHAESVL